MIPYTKREEIVDQLDALNAKQADDVLVYIKEMLYGKHTSMGTVSFKQRALAEINQALHGV